MERIKKGKLKLLAIEEWGEDKAHKSRKLSNEILLGSFFSSRKMAKKIARFYFIESSRFMKKL